MRFILLCISILFVWYTPSFAQQTVTYREYEKELNDLLILDQKYREQIASEQTLILNYRNKIDELKKRIKDIQQQKLLILGITQTHVRNISQILGLQSERLMTISNLNDQQLKLEINSINEISSILDSLRMDPAMKLTAIGKKLNDVTRLLTLCKNRIAATNNSVIDTINMIQTTLITSPSINTYTVGSFPKKPETLFSIAAKVYGDPLRWPDLYNANKETIDKNFEIYTSSEKKTTITNPSDLILPGQVLLIPHNK